MRRFLLASVAATVACVWAASAFGGGALIYKDAVLYVDGVKYRSIDTPAFYNEKASASPAHTWDTLYVFPSGPASFFQLHVADAGPGDRDYNGGRWIVQAVFFADYAAAAATYGGANGVLDNDAEVLAAIAGTGAQTFEVFRLECPVLPLFKNG